MANCVGLIATKVTILVEVIGFIPLCGILCMRSANCIVYAAPSVREVPFVHVFKLP